MAEPIGAIALEVVGLEALTSVIVIGSTTVAAVVGSTILVAGSVGLQLLLAKQKSGSAPGAPALPAPEAGHQPLRQAIAPRMVGYGRVRLAGAYVLFEAQSGVSWDVIALHHGRIGGFVGYYLHDDVVTIGAGGVVDVQGDGRYGSSKLTIKTRLGADPEAAYTEVTSALPSIWTAAHRGDGMASLMLKCDAIAAVQDFPDVYPRGKPEPSVVADCSPIYDPRDEAQDRDDDSTWLVSANPVLQLIDFLTDADRGMGLEWDVLIAPALADLMAEADLCDAAVLRADGTSEVRYASNGAFPLDADPADVITSMLDTCDGWLSQNGDGSLVLRVGVYRAPAVTLASRHIRGYSLQYGVADEEVVNELTIDYTDPLLDYKTSPGQPWRNEADISARGKVRSQRFALPWVYSHAQARRLAKRRDAQNNAALRGTLTTTLYGLRCLGERWVRIAAPDLPDLADLVIEVRGMTVDITNASCAIRFVSVDPATIDAWDPASDEGAAPTVPAKLVFPPPPVPQNITAAAAGGSIGGFNAIVVSLDDPGRSDLTFQAEWRVNGSGGAFTLDPAPVAPDPTATGIYGRPTVRAGIGMPSGHTYEVKLRSFAPAGAGSAFSASTTVTI